MNNKRRCLVTPVATHDFYKQCNNRINAFNACQATSLATGISHISRHNADFRHSIATCLLSKIEYIKLGNKSLIVDDNDNTVYRRVMQQALAFKRHIMKEINKADSLTKVIFDSLDDVIYLIMLSKEFCDIANDLYGTFSGYFPIEYNIIRDLFLNDVVLETGYDFKYDYKMYDYKQYTALGLSADKEIITIASVQLFGFSHVSVISVFNQNKVAIYDPYGDPNDAATKRSGAYNVIVKGKSLKRYLSTRSFIKGHVFVMQPSISTGRNYEE